MDFAPISSFYEENGYYLARGVYDPIELKSLDRDFDRIVAQLSNSGDHVNARWGGEMMDKIDGGSSVIVHTHQVQNYSSVWMRALQQERFLDCTEAIIGPDIILHHSKLFQKPPENGAPFPMHQDWTYFPTEMNSMMAGIIHVSKATDEMGCLRVYPGSHKLGRVEGTSGTTKSELLEQYPIEGATVVECEPGDVIFFHYCTLHGSMPNRSKETRKTVLVQMHSGHDCLQTLNHPNARVALRGWNHAMNRKLANES